MTDTETPKTEVTVNALPKKSTLDLSPGQRALSRMARIKLHQEPAGDAQRDLAGDVFNELYQAEPNVRNEIPRERALNRAMLDWMAETHGWEQSRASTVGNLPAAMQASSLMWDHLTNDETINEAMKQQETADEAQREADTQQRAADAMKQAAENLDAEGDHTGAHQLRNDAQAAMMQAEAAQQRAQAAAQTAADLLADAQGKPLKQAQLAKASRDAAEEAQAIAEAGAGWGLGAGSEIHRDPAAALEFLKANTGKIARIARLAGRLRGFALQARMERSPRGITPTKAGVTQDLMRTFPTELALLRPDAPATLRAEKMAQFVESGLLGYVPTGDAEKDGPFVAAVDVSPSMRHPEGREIVAKAVALGVAQVAKQDGREYILFAFGSDPNLITVVRSSDPWAAHLAWAAASQGGGTDFDMAIGKSLELLGDLQRADCLFISDGEAGILDTTVRAWRSFQEETGARLFYVPVGRGGYIDIEDLADRTYEVSEMDEATGADLAGQLGQWL